MKITFERIVEGDLIRYAANCQIPEKGRFSGSIAMSNDLIRDDHRRIIAEQLGVLLLGIMDEYDKQANALRQLA